MNESRDSGARPVMFKSDRPSMMFLVTVEAFIRVAYGPRIVHGLSRTSLRSVRLAQFLAEKFYGDQCGNHGGTDHGGNTNLLAR
jgi:hypothetical protein